ncbi:chitobiase/beta-hexosaminidase C-terminal domain-containing protein [Paenibacillus sp. KQZ6P-2]|uniref:Chitobiase/beta-hexosaminidase C-terminal domain-containing protein n=1 Tax=Paenibacillus mangrovi TaxID=2931978 RepID=A0A9X1WT48_9BACL|nr:chitobiase/beta-hexosaminidase C-terminal domain-containing protein [Paenibacillus mangrovi]MCJ8014216.1 chitobiase/beta-hexosaminidase C-terminal domain-containing protein [Paenibacillus mangrovi]
MKKYYKKITSAALAFAMATTTFAFTNTKVSASDVNVQAQSNAMATIYVSTTGNDTSGDGSQANPFATLQKAQQAVRQINQNMTGDIKVSIAPGDYYMPGTLNFTSQDSGTNGYNIVYESSGGIGAAKLYGGIPVTGTWTLAEQSDATNYGMLTSMVGKVWKIQLDTANYPTTFSGLNSPAFNTLYVNDARATMARTPNLMPQAGFPEAKDNYNRVSGSSNGSNIQINKSDLTPEQINGLQLAQQNGIEVAQVFTWDGGTGGVSGSWDWFTDTEPVASINVGTSTITLNQPQANGSDFYHKYQYYVKYPVSNGSRYFLQHNLSFLDTPDEYYYDKTHGILYYYPADGTMTNKTVVTPTMQTVINMQGTPKANPGDQPDPALQVHNIVFDGLAVMDTEFSDYYSYSYNYGDMGGIGAFPPVALAQGVTMPAYAESADRPAFQVGSITMQGTNNITIKNSLIKNAGIYGIFMLGDNQYNTIVNSTVENTGDGGISIDGGYPGVGKYSNHHTINNVLIHDVGQLVGHGVGLTVMSCGQSTFSHLEIYNSPKRGMLILGGYPRGGKSANPNFDNVRDNYTVGNHFSYIYLHHTHQDAGEDSSLFMSWLTAGGGQWYSAATQHGSNDVNHLTTNLSQIDPSVDRYNYMDQVLIANIGTAASVHEKDSVGGLDTAMGATGFVFSNVQAINTQSHSLAIRPGNSGGYGDMYIFQNVTNNIDDISSVQSFDPSKMQYDLIGLTSSFPTPLLGTNPHTYPQTSPSNVYFSDTFNDSALDATKWTVEKGSVDMSLGVLASPNDPRLGIRSLPIFTPTNLNGVVVSRLFEQPINKVVTVKFFDRHKDYFFGDPPTTSPNDPYLAHTYLRVDDGKNILGIGANGEVSKDYYTIQKGNQSIVTNVRRDFGWRTLTMDYSSGTDVKISIDNQQVADYTVADGIATAFTYVGMGDWGKSWPDGKPVGSSTDFGDFYIYGGQDAPPVQPLVTIPPTAVQPRAYVENFSQYPLGSTARPTGWADSRDGSSNPKASYQIVQDATVGKVMRITEPDNVIFYGLGDNSLTNYTLTLQSKFVSWSGNSNGTYATFGPSVYVSGNNGGNVSRYELRYNYPNLSNGQWVIYQRGGNPADNNLVTNIQMPAGFNMNDWNTYKIVAGNGYITFFVNGTQVAQVSNPGNAFGGFGLGGYDATFDVANISLVQNPINPPSANLSSGTYSNPQSVTLTPANASDSVYYTTDGSDPAIFGTLYTGNPIKINASSILKVAEVNSAGVYSATVGYNYTISGTTAAQTAAGVNKQPLRDAITNAMSVKQGNYSTACWNAFKSAIASANSVLKNTNASDSDVINAVALLQTARAKLIPTFTSGTTTLYSEDFSGYTVGSTSAPTGWTDNRTAAGLSPAPVYSIVSDTTNPNNASGKALNIKTPDNIVYTNLGNSSWTSYTATANIKFAGWGSNPGSAAYANFAPISVYVSARSGGNVNRYELRYVYNNLANGSWIIYQRNNSGSPADKTLVSNIQMPSGFDMNNWNSYKAVVSPSSITFYVNGTQVAQVPNPSNAFGGVGFGGINNEFRIDNLTVTNNASSVTSPTVDKAAGTFANPVTVNVTPGTSGNSVYYTLDGSDPTINGTLQTGPIAINKSCTLKVVEVSSSGYFSSISSYAYTITNPASATPVMVVNPRSQSVTDPQPVSFGTMAYASDGGTLTYQWQVSTDNGTTWSNISGATSSTYTTVSPVTVADDGTQYQCMITNTEGSLIPAIYTTPAVILNVVAMPTSTITDSFKISAKSVTPSNSVSDGTNGPTGTATVTFTATQAGTYYYSVVYSGAAKPTLNTSGTGAAGIAGDNTFSIPNLAPYVPYTVYIQEKDSNGKLSNILKMDIGSGTPTLGFSTSGNGTVTQGSGGRYLSGTAMPVVATPAEGFYFLNWTTSNGGVFADANSSSTEFVTSFYDNTVTANFYNVSNFNVTTTGTVNGGTNIDLNIDVEGTNLNNPGAAVGMYVLVNGKSYAVTAGTQNVNVVAPSSSNKMTVQLYDQSGNLLGTTDIPIAKTLAAIMTPAPVTGVANGTAKTADDLGLPATVQLETNSAESMNANVTWDVEASSYDPSVKTEQTFTVSGTVTLPEGVANPNQVPLTTSISVTVNEMIDKTGPELTIELDQTTIWPANNKMVTVKATVNARAESGVKSVVLTSITCNEPDSGQGDIQANIGSEDTTFGLRAVRLGAGSGRVYTITYTATDNAGNQTVATATVTVPHDQSGKPGK